MKKVSLFSNISSKTLTNYELHNRAFKPTFYLELEGEEFKSQYKLEVESFYTLYNSFKKCAEIFENYERKLSDYNIAKNLGKKFEYTGEVDFGGGIGRYTIVSSETSEEEINKLILDAAHTNSQSAYVSRYSITNIQ